jgi:LPXTG-motif cell wall-anchored protein
VLPVTGRNTTGWFLVAIGLMLAGMAVLAGAARWRKN